MAEDYTIYQLGCLAWVKKTNHRYDYFFSKRLYSNRKSNILVSVVSSLTGSNKINAGTDDNEKQPANHIHRSVERYVMLTSRLITSSSPVCDLSSYHRVNIIHNWMQTFLSHQSLKHSTVKVTGEWDGPGPDARCAMRVTVVYGSAYLQSTLMPHSIKSLIDRLAGAS